MRTPTADPRTLARTATLLAAACVAACGPDEPKRLPPVRPAEAPAGGVAAALTDSPVVTVTQSDESPVAGCKVSAFDPSTNAKAAGGTTDASGVVRFAGIDTKRRYELVVEPPLDRADAFEAVRTHSWAPSDTAVRLAAFLTVEGRVTGEDGSPAKGVAVRCSHAGGAVSVAVGADGRFAFRRVPEGPVKLSVAATWADAERGRCGPPTDARAGDRDVVLRMP